MVTVALRRPRRASRRAPSALDPEDVRAPSRAVPRSSRGQSSSGSAARSRSSSATPSWPSSAPPSPTRTTRSGPSGPRSPSATGRPSRARSSRSAIAVKTGEALVTLDARPGEGEAMAAGDVVNTAARLQAAAPVNGVLVGDQTQRATVGVIDYRPAAPVEAKGKQEPVRAWEVLEARSRFGIDASQRRLGPLVGRARETRAAGRRRSRASERSGPPSWSPSSACPASERAGSSSSSSDTSSSSRS